MASAQDTRSTDRREAAMQEVTAWFIGRCPDAWFAERPHVLLDREEILVVGRLGVPVHETEPPAQDGGDDADGPKVAARARIEAFREETRDARIRIARDAEHLWGRKVSWGARCGEEERLFTTAGVPVMTRLRMDERAVLDTLIDAGVARSRSEALAWCVRLVGSNQSEWIDRLRSALDTVDQVKAEGP